MTLLNSNLISALGAPLAGLAATLGLTFVPGDLSSLAVLPSAAYTGYAIAEKTRDSSKGRLQDQLALEIQRRKEKTARIQDLEQRDRTYRQTQERLQEQLRLEQGLVQKLRAELNRGSRRQTSEAQQLRLKYGQELQALKDQLAQETAVNDRLNEHVSTQQAAISQGRVLKSDVRLELESQIEDLEGDIAEWQERYAQLESGIDSASGEVIGTIQGLVDKNGEQYQNARQQTEAILTELAQAENRIKDLERELDKPARFGGLGTADIVGNSLIDFLMSNDVLMQAVETDPDPDRGLMVRLKPVTAVAVADIEKLMPQLEVFLKLYGLPTVVYKNGSYAFRLAVDKPLTGPGKVKLTNNLKRLETAIDLANHIRLVGPSGSGKSTVLDNLIWLGKCLWPDATLDLFDPKYPFTEWSSLIPTYKGSEDTVTGIDALATAMDNRMSKATSAADNGLELPQFSRHIFAIDEAAEAYTRAKQIDRKEGRGSKVAQSFADNLSSLLRLGRALDVKGYFLSQSALCSKVGLNVDDFDNATSVFLNAAIDKALTDELKDRYSAQQLTATRKEYDRRKAEGQTYIGLVSDLNNDDLFLFEAPRPGFYKDRYDAENGVQVSGRFDASTPARQPSAQNVQTPATTTGAASADLSPAASPAQPSAAVRQPLAQPAHTHRAICPECSQASTKLERSKADSKGRFRFKCENDSCASKTFRAENTVTENI